MRIHLATDHSGYALARHLEGVLAGLGHDVVWHGAAESDDGDDYPAFTISAAQAVVADEDRGVDARGIVVGLYGAGETVAANKVNGARAIPALGHEFAAIARQHLDANVLAIGAALLDAEAAASVVLKFLSTEFLVAIDDVRRVMHTAEFESSGTIEGWNIA